MGKQREFKVGDKVIPHNKSIGHNLEQSSVWERARKNNQPFLYINSIGENELILNNIKKPIHIVGDYFLKSDVTLYRPEIKRVISNPPAVVVILEDGSKGVAKCHPKDKFDYSFGIKIAEAKAREDKKEVDRLIEERYGNKEREVDYLEAREIIKNGGKIRVKSMWGDIIYFMEEDKLKWLDVENNLTHFSSGVNDNIHNKGSKKYYYVVEEPKKVIDKPVFDKKLEDILLKTDLKFYSTEELEGELEKRKPKGKYPSELVGKKVIRIAPCIRGRFIDKSFMRQPITVLKVIKEELYIINNFNTLHILPKDWLDNNWIEYKE